MYLLPTITAFITLRVADIDFCSNNVSAAAHTKKDGLMATNYTLSFCYSSPFRIPPMFSSGTWNLSSEDRVGIKSSSYKKCKMKSQKIFPELIMFFVFVKNFDGVKSLTVFFADSPVNLRDRHAKPLTMQRLPQSLACLMSICYILFSTYFQNVTYNDIGMLLITMSICSHMVCRFICTKRFMV